MTLNNVKIFKTFLPKFNCIYSRVNSTTNTVGFRKVNIKTKNKKYKKTQSTSKMFKYQLKSFKGTNVSCLLRLGLLLLINRACKIFLLYLLYLYPE